MSNIGLEIALRDAGIGMLRCPVGDKYVMEELVRRDLSLGGEQSGHVIFSEYLFTGDGIVDGALRPAGDGRDGPRAGGAGRRAGDLSAGAGERARREKKRSGRAGNGGGDGRVEKRLTARGRLLVRYSGTEPLLRIMIEGQDQARSRPGPTRSRPRCGRPRLTAARRWSSLSVNVNKVATLRNSRGGPVPSVLDAVHVCRGRRAGHHRASARATRGTSRRQDVLEIAAALQPLRGRVEFNIEANPRPT